MFSVISYTFFCALNGVKYTLFCCFRMVEFSYKNEGSRMVVLRCIGPSNFFLERVLFPTDILTFKAPNDSRVEIWGNELYGPKLEERIRISSETKDSKLVA